MSYALVTGASSGLGRDFATILAERGYDLILVARRADRLESLKDELIAAHRIDVVTISKDLAVLDAAAGLHAEVRAKGLEVEVLVNNAGLGIYGLFTDIDWAREVSMLQLDIVTLVHLTKLFTRDMVARGKGYVLQISSIGAYQPSPTYASYAAAKTFVLHFGEAINHELKGTGVSVSVLSPGVTATEFLAVSGQKPTLYQRMAMMQSRPVCEIGIRAMFKRKGSVVPGLLNKLTAFSIRFTPRRMATWLAFLLMRNPELGESPAARR